MKSVTFTKLRCIRSYNSKGDSCCVDLFIDGVHVKRTRKAALKSGLTWSLNRKYPVKSHFGFEVRDEKQGMPLGKVDKTVLSFPTGTYTSSFRSGHYDYQLEYKIAPTATTVDQKVAKVVNGQKRYVLHRKAVGCYELLLTKNAGPWNGNYVWTDQPDVNYCGPTAAMNLLHWHGESSSWNTLADLMKTNTWDESIPFWVLADPIASQLVGLIKGEIIKLGSLTKDVRVALTAPTVRPGEMKLRYKEGEGILPELTDQLRRGRPVMVLYSPKPWGLHWAVVTGVYKYGSKVMVRLANGGIKNWGDFHEGWRLNIPFDPFRTLLAGLSLKPFSMQYYY